MADQSLPLIRTQPKIDHNILRCNTLMLLNRFSSMPKKAWLAWQQHWRTSIAISNSRVCLEVKSDASCILPKRLSCDDVVAHSMSRELVYPVDFFLLREHYLKYFKGCFLLHFLVYQGRRREVKKCTTSRKRALLGSVKGFDKEWVSGMETLDLGLII